MANELSYAGATGLTLTATLTQAGAAVGSAIAMTESATILGLYLASVAGGTAAGTYTVVVKQGTVVEGSGALRWDGAAEVFGAPASDVTTLLSRITGAVALAVDWTTARATKLDTLPSATAGAAGGIFIAGSNAATSITTAFTANIVGNVTGGLSGSVGSVTGNIGGVAVGGITASSFATDAINANSLAADAAAEIATGVWANGTRVLTSGANIALAKGVGLTGLNDPTVAAVAGGVWDELLSGHAVAGSAGAKLSAASGGSAGLDAAGVRAAVGLASANLDTQIGAVASKTANLPASPAAVGDIPSAATVAAAVWAAVSRTLTSTALTAADVWTYAIRVLTSAAAPTAAANAAAVRTEIAPELARLDVTVGSRNAIAPDNAVIAAIQAKTTNLPADPASQAAVLGALGATSGALAAAVLGATAGAGTVSDAMARINLQPAGVPVQLVPAAPVDIGLCRVYGYFSTPDGQPAAGVKIEFKFISPGFTRSARIVAGRTVVATTSKLGELASDAGPFLDLLRTDLLTTPGVTYQVSSAELGVKNKVIVLTTGTADLRALLAAA